MRELGAVALGAFHYSRGGKGYVSPVIALAGMGKSSFR